MSNENNLVKIQNELKVPKGNFNPFGKYKYRSAEDILEAVKPLLNKHNCKLVLTDEIMAIGNKLFLCATCKFTDFEKEEWFPKNKEKEDPQYCDYCNP
jgi:hypothetical protein